MILETLQSPIIEDEAELLTFGKELAQYVMPSFPGQLNPNY